MLKPRLSYVNKIRRTYRDAETTYRDGSCRERKLVGSWLNTTNNPRVNTALFAWSEMSESIPSILSSSEKINHLSGLQSYQMGGPCRLTLQILLNARIYLHLRIEKSINIL